MKQSTVGKQNCWIL